MAAFLCPKLLIIHVLFLGMAGLTAHAQESASGDVPYELVRIDWEHTVPAGDTLVLDNPWGDIHLRQTGATAATLHAVMQKIGEQPKVGELKAEREDGRTVLRFVYPDDQQPANPREGRIDAALLVPYGVKLEIIADRGKVESKTMESHIKLNAQDEAVSLKLAAGADIQARGAEIDIQFVPRAEDDNGSDRGRIQTISGDINVRYYPDMAMRFEMLSGRPKTTNDLELLRNRKLTGRQVIMHTGQNPETLYVQSDTGYIRLINTGSEILLTPPEQQ